MLPNLRTAGHRADRVGSAQTLPFPAVNFCNGLLQDAGNTFTKARASSRLKSPVPRPGSCLGIGGICAYSSAAVLLDVNKQVLYARNRQGKVVGRQLLAIADDNRVICFHVYPLSSSKIVKSLFLDYDPQFCQCSRAFNIQPSGE